MQNDGIFVLLHYHSVLFAVVIHSVECFRKLSYQIFYLMKKHLLSLITLLAVFVSSMSAQVFLEDNFTYSSGTLVGQGGWVRYGTASNNPVQVTSEQLSYEGYASNVGKAIELQSLSATDEDVAVKFTSGDEESVTSGSLYYSMLLNVKSMTDDKTNNAYIAGLVQRRVNSSSSFPNNGNVYGKLFVKKSSDGKFKIGLNRSSDAAAAQLYTETEYDMGTTYLVVVKYEIVGTNESVEQTDIVSLYVNPATDGGEPTAATLVYNNSSYTSNNDFRINPTAATKTYGLWGLQLMQNFKVTANFPNVLVGNVRVADSWARLMKQGGGEPPVGDPKITASKTSLSFGSSNYGFALTGKEYTATLNVKGTGLKDNISISGLESGQVVADKTSLSKDAANAASGVDITLTLKPSSNMSGEASDKLILASEGADTVEIALAWYEMAPTVIGSINGMTETEDYTTLYKLNTEAVITHRQGTTLYIQDSQYGGQIIDETGLLSDLPVGTCLKDITGFGYHAGMTGYSLRVEEDITVYNVGTPTDATMGEPEVMTLQQMATQGVAKHNRLVKIEGVSFGHLSGSTFSQLEEGEVFATDKSVHVKDAEGTTATMRIFAGADFIGEAIPQTGDIIGLSTAVSGSVIAPRSKADIIDNASVDPVEPSMLWNGSFEEWQSGAFGMVTPSSWETALGESSKETALIKDGTYALRLKAGSNSTSGKLRQEIKPDPTGETAFIAGEQYELTINYHIVKKNADGNALVLNSFWRNGDEVLDGDKDVLNNGEQLAGEEGQWAEKTIITTVPANANGFYFSLQVDKKAEVVFDNFSFRRHVGDEPQIFVSPQTLQFNTTLGTPIQKEILIKTTNISNPTSLEITGVDKSHFSISQSTIAAGSHSTVVTVTYNPTAVSNNHKASLLIDPQTTGLSAIVSLTGSNYDPAALPKISVTPTSLDFEAEVGKVQTKTVIVNSENIADYYITARVGDTSSGQFALTSGALVKNTETTLEITFRPTEVGTHTQTVVLSASGAESVTINLTGVATASTTPDKEGDSWPLSELNPLKLMIENFDNVGQNNKPISIEGWKNIAEKGKRAWWGYTIDGEKAAKVTAYYYGVDERTEAEQWLVTPALDFKNAENKLFTFRVRGDFMPDEGLEDKLDLCLMYYDAEKNLQAEVINAGIPTTADNNEDWLEIHLNLNGAEYQDIIPDVFFMGFRFHTLNAGSHSSVVYYVDDVTWGRTDVPTLTPSTTAITENTPLKQEWTSQPITVAANQLTNPITLSLGGPSASYFSLPVAELPATGGQFVVKMKASDDEASYGAYVRISSRGAADVYVMLAVNATNATGITDITGENASQMTIYDIQGRKINSNVITRPGLYIVNGKKVLIK